MTSISDSNSGKITQTEVLDIPKFKKIESKNEITIVGEYKYERQRVCEHRHIFLLPENDNSHMLKWKSFKCIFVTVTMSDDQQ